MGILTFLIFYVLNLWTTFLHILASQANTLGTVNTAPTSHDYRNSDRGHFIDRDCSCQASAMTNL